MNITILGAGAWGTAVAIALAAKNNVVLCGRNQKTMQQAQHERVNHQYLPGFTLPESITVSSDFSLALRHIQSDGLLIIGASVSGLRPLLIDCLPYQIKQVIWLCKGFEENSHLLPHQVVEEIMGSNVASGALSGPSFAQEVAKGLPCALTIASRSEQLCQTVVKALHGPAIRVYSTDDVIGVEVGGAVKNILAIATGINDGLGLGLNARAALMTRGMAEIGRLCIAMGGRTETLMGLTGLGDLILTCTGSLSRNRKVGLALAEGKALSNIVEELGQVAEGVRCALAVRALAKKYKIDMPITDAVADVLFENLGASQAIGRLLARDAKSETE
jgi:glycerol-3-phosphate dehydrogenase (NAD(P)+)